MARDSTEKARMVRVAGLVRRMSGQVEDATDRDTADAALVIALKAAAQNDVDLDDFLGYVAIMAVQFFGQTMH